MNFFMLWFSPHFPSTLDQLHTSGWRECITGYSDRSQSCSCVPIWTSLGHPTYLPSISNLKVKHFPRNVRMSKMDDGFGISIMDLILAGSTSMPRLETRKPNKLPQVTTKMHFPGFKLTLYLFRRPKAMSKS